MLKNKKILLVSIIVILSLCAVLIVGILVLKNVNNNTKEPNNGTENQADSTENLEKNFDSLFTNIEYTDSEDTLVKWAYNIEKSEDGKYDINANIPLFNAETDTTKEINNEIKNVFAKKLIDIMSTSEAYTIYKIDYITYTNGNVVSLVIKCVLKEGSNPQRVIIQTYNYDTENDKVLTLDDIIQMKELDKESIQKQIDSKIKENNVNAEKLKEQGYNIFTRDINSEEYKIENVKTFFLDEKGNLYIVFAYGNTNFTQETDVVVIK